MLLKLNLFVLYVLQVFKVSGRAVHKHLGAWETSKPQINLEHRLVLLAWISLVLSSVNSSY